jgi:hypothetical protein
VSGLLVVLALVVIAVVLIKKRDRLTFEVDPEDEMRAAIALHRIGRRLDVALSRTQMRAESARVKRGLSKALKDEE